MTKTILIGLGIGAAALAIAGGAVAQRSKPPGFGGGYAWRDGAGIYTHVCQGCHMPDAKGAVGAGAYPALAGNPKLASGLYPALVIVRGQKTMPAFSELDDAQVAAVVNYVRSNFGNHFTDAVTAAQVAAIRPKPKTLEGKGPG